jgi:hypothetical protein
MPLAAFSLFGVPQHRVYPLQCLELGVGRLIRVLVGVQLQRQAVVGPLDVGLRPDGQCGVSRPLHGRGNAEEQGRNRAGASVPLPGARRGLCPPGVCGAARAGGGRRRQRRRQRRL